MAPLFPRRAPAPPQRLSTRRHRLVGCLTLLSLAAAGLSACLTDPEPEAGGGARAGAGAADPADFELLAGRDLELDAQAYAVTHVRDGDTIEVGQGGRSVPVRLIGINSPESADPRRPVQCFGQESATYMRALVEGEAVYLAADPSQSRVDSYGRRLAYVWLEDGRLVNRVLLSDGYANEYTYDHTNPYRLRAAFREARDDARDAERGLWAPETCAGDFDAPVGGSDG